MACMIWAQELTTVHTCSLTDSFLCSIAHCNDVNAQEKPLSGWTAGYSIFLELSQLYRNSFIATLGIVSKNLVQSRFAETRFAETPTLTLNPNFGESGFGESGRHQKFCHLQQCTLRVHRVLEKSLKVLEFWKINSRPLKVLEKSLNLNAAYFEIFAY